MTKRSLKKWMKESDYERQVSQQTDDESKKKNRGEL